MDYPSGRQLKKFLINRRTVRRYLSMSELGAENMAIEQSDRVKLLTPFEPFVKSRLEKFRDTPRGSNQPDTGEPLPSLRHGQMAVEAASHDTLCQVCR